MGEVQGFPTIRFEGKDGSVKEYDGPRTAESMQEFASMQLKALDSGVPAVDEAAPTEAAPTETMPSVKED